MILGCKGLMENQLICSHVNFYILTEGYTVCFA